MKKQELLNTIKEAGHSSSNLKTLVNRNKEIRQAVEKTGLDTVLKWLYASEKREREIIARKLLMENAKSWNMSGKEYKALQDKAKALLASFHTGHSMGCYRSLCIGDRIFAENDTLEEYANSCSYRPIYGNIYITLTKKELREIENIHGVWTIRTGNFRAKWVSSSGRKHNYSVLFEEGFLVGESHASNLKEAYRLEKVKREREKTEMMKNSRFIGIQHVIETGACEQGIKAFAEKHGLNLEYGYQLGYLKSLDDNGYLRSI